MSDMNTTKEKTKSKKVKKPSIPLVGELIIPPKDTETSYQLHVVDKKTGKTVEILDSVEDMQLLGMSLKIKSSEKQEWESAISPIQSFSPNQLVSLKNILNEMGPTAQRSLIEEAIQNIIDQSSNKDTFALPSHALMFTLLAMFAGKPDMIPRRLLSKPHSEWTAIEQKEAEEFLSSILKVEKSTSYLNGRETSEEKYIAVVSDNPKVEAQAEIDISLFKSDIHFREVSLALYIKRTFGAEGLRHLLGFLIGLEENFRKGHFIWSVNDHLARLGHRKKANGTYDHELKKTASEIIRVFQSLFITARKKEGKKEVIQGERLFSIDGFRQEIFDKVIIDEKIKLRATDFWYKNAFEPKDGQSAKYTKLLKKIAQENHREHPLTIYLTPLLAIFWRMNPQQKISIPSLMDWCDLDPSGRYKMRNLRSLESELSYMKEHGYLGDWSHTGEKFLPSECTDPFSCSLTLTPPEWLGQELRLVQANREIPALEKKEDKIVGIEEFKEIYKKSKLNVRQFGNHLGITGQMVSFLLNEKRHITKEVSDKVRAFADKFS
jgi:hypothetical protein